MIALASASPRRRELLGQLQQDFVLVSGTIDETQLVGETANQYVLRLAEQKAQAGFSSQSTPLPTLGADTIVQVDDLVLGKPVDLADFQRMMRLLSGRSHWVKTAVAIATEQGVISTTVATKVWFKQLSEQEILWYWNTGEPADKAGGYGIQGLAGQFVQRIDGSYFAVVGLPLYETAQLLQALKDAAMSAELLINVTPSETRVALIENGVLQEVHIERQAKHGLVGNIYMGKISRVLPGMQAAFVDIGLDKAAFLHASDIVTAGLNIADAELKAGPVKDIRLLVHEGQYLLVQVVKDPLGH